jgi:hypothetical protein
MGILDDAIREHLELKRSHGATDDEIKRKEEEVFGAPRAEVAPAPPSADEHTQLLSPDEAPHAVEDLEPLQPAPEDPYAVHPGDDLVPDPKLPDTEHHDISAAAEAGAGMLEPHRVEPGPPSQPIHDHRHDEQHPALVDHDHIGGEEHPPEPVFRQSAEAPAVEPPPVEEPPTEEPPVEEPDITDPAPVEGDDDEDVLEETPEFLQDAPEHDRLWFEQKPPRDFDFGE